MMSRFITRSIAMVPIAVMSHVMRSVATSVSTAHSVSHIASQLVRRLGAKEIAAFEPLLHLQLSHGNVRLAGLLDRTHDCCLVRLILFHEVVDLQPSFLQGGPEIDLFLLALVVQIAHLFNLLAAQP
mgnify:CR=1 FL=1